MNIDRLVTMANDIATYFQSEPDHATAVAGMALHLRRFWDPRMRQLILAHMHDGGAGLLPLTRDALAALDAGDDGPGRRPGMPTPGS